MRSAVVCILALSLAVAPSTGVADENSDRSRARAKRACASELGERDLTLFANGTLRWKESTDNEPRIRLVELGPDAHDRYLERFRRVDLSEVEGITRGPRGDWLGECRIELDLGWGTDTDAVHAYSFGRHDAWPLAIMHLWQIFEELQAEFDDQVASRLPPDYKAHAGDVLRHLDGQRYQVIGETADGDGVELQSLDQPLVLYLKADELRSQFVDFASVSER